MSLGIGRNKNKRRWRSYDWSHWQEAREALDMCNGKICYGTLDDAEAMARQQMEKWNIPLRAYHHWDGCGDFHLTKRVV